MIYLVAFLLFYAISAGCWAAAAALYRGFTDDPSVDDLPHRRTVGRLAAAALAVTRPVPFPVGYLLGLVVGPFGGADRTRVPDPAPMK